MTFTLSAPSFSHEGAIPTRHTCDGLDLSPALAWTGAPSKTQSLVLIVDDPDAPDPQAPTTTWVHWLLYNLPPQAKTLAEGIANDALPAGTRHGTNDWHRTDYGGPCPPIGRHRYFFKLYALDISLPDLHNPNKALLEQAMQGHILAQTQLMGQYQRHL